MLPKVYVEITNICNLHCSFCPGTSRSKEFMPIERFETIADKLAGKTRYLYLHVLGEPLLHPRLGEIIDIAGRYGFKVCITTNGTLLTKVQDVLLSADNIHKISISLHSLEANSGAVYTTYYDDCIDFARIASHHGIITVLRLWNQGGEDKNNELILSKLGKAFNDEKTPTQNGYKLAEKCYLEWGQKFDWPSPNAPIYGGRRFCMALRDQIAVLCDGTVVPCCLDGEGRMPLGNLLTDDYDYIVGSKLARDFVQSFSDGKAPCDMCQRCGYSKQKFG